MNSALSSLSGEAESQKLVLTEKGMLLRRRTEELLALAKKTEDEMTRKETEVAGDLNIGGGESTGMNFIANPLKDINEEYPNIKFHLYSGNAENVMERLEGGLLDFALFVGNVNLTRYNTSACRKPTPGGFWSETIHCLRRARQ